MLYPFFVEFEKDKIKNILWRLVHDSAYLFFF